MRYVYIVRCADNSLYVGESGDLDRRLVKHNAASASLFTAKRRPVVLVHREEYATRAHALKRERQLKRRTRAKKEALIAGDIDLLKRL